MKIPPVFAMLFLLAGPCVLAQNPPSTSAADKQGTQSATGQKGNPQETNENQPKIDPAKEADIRQLMELAGTRALMTQTLNLMIGNIKPVMEKALPPGDYRPKLVDLFFERFRSKADMQELLNLAVPYYDKYYSDDEIKGLIKFYQSPLGQKYVSVLPKLAAELQLDGRKWGEKIGGECMMEVLSEHPELQKALEEAKKPNSSNQ